MVPRVAVAALVLAGVAAPPAAADEAQLSRAFVGREVLILMDLPATKKGLDFYPRRRQAVDAAEYNKRLGQDGIGVREGDRVVVTKIKVKKKHIEFQLGAGGASQMPSKPSVYVPQSELEEELEEQLDATTDERERKRLKTMLAAERDRRRQERELKEAL